MFLQVLQYWERRKSRQRWLVFVIVILAITVLLTMFRGLDQFNWFISDTVARLDKRTPSSEIVIITIDDDSIRAIGGWPWGRDKHASLLTILQDAGAKAVGFDLIMTGPDMVSLQGDAALMDVLSRPNKAVLPIIAYIPIGGEGWVEVEQPFYAQKNPFVQEAHINLTPDSDGVARRVYLQEGRDGVGGGVWYHMAAKLWLQGDSNHTTGAFKARRAPPEIQRTLTTIESMGADSSVIQEGWLRDYEILIPYVGAGNEFKRYSYYDVYFGLVPKEDFKDKYVLIGAVASGLGDIYSTPSFGNDAVIPGIEILANILDGLLQNEYRYEATDWQNILYNLFVVGFMIPLFYFARPKGVLIGAITLITLNFFWVFLFRRYAGIQLAPASSMLVLALTYPFWAWRRLEQAMGHIREEFTRMRRENGFFQPPRHLAGDLLERDLQIFESASWQLRELQQMVRQSMDILPYIMLVTDQHGQVILSNMAARKFFKVFPPLPTMAFEPAMDMDGKRSKIVTEHQLSVLFEPYFMGSLSSQKDQQFYAAELLSYIKKKGDQVPVGEIELTDVKKNTSYLLKVITRTSTIEQSQGWIVTLVDLSSVQQSEMQRDQLLRYLQSNVLMHVKELEVQALRDDQSMSEGFERLRSQMESFISFQYTQSAIYFYEKLELAQILVEAMSSVTAAHPLWKASDIYQEGTPVILDGDAQMLTRAFSDLIRLMVQASAGEKMPLIKISEKLPADDASNGEHFVRIIFMVAIHDGEVAASKIKTLNQDVQRTGIPDNVEIELLNWWSAQYIINRHLGQINVQLNAQSLAITVEFLKQ